MEEGFLHESLKLKMLYEEVNEIKSLSGYQECFNCPDRCKRSLEIHWLLPEEAKILSLKGLKTLKINLGSLDTTAFFFKGGLCDFLSSNGCGIYQYRPLECRLNPLSIYKNRFVLYNECPVFQNRPAELTENAKLLIAPLTKFLRPWYNYFEILSAVIASINPEIDNKIVPIGGFSYD